ncbi:MAG: M20/M25/M40 family metallo-hydrolase [Candidatus Tectomicrobia bacterium]|nr:M20/M25/M40 family metallo-hydrolase [Candidatus Tectomicrobia bacterium]
MNVDAVLSLIDREELASLVLRFANIPSPTGSEEAVGQAVYDWLKENGFEARRMEVAPGRFNVMALLKGTGEGKSLIFNGHLDTKYGAPDDIWSAGDIFPEYMRAWREGDLLFGHGVFNDKGPLSATFLAARAIRDSGMRLRGDLYLTAVVGEIGTAPVDEFQGPRYVGKGVGARHLVDHGVYADYALVAECTNFSTTWAQCGCAYFQITTRGTGLYTPTIPRPTTLTDNPNAIVKMAQVVNALETWANGYIERESVRFEGGVIRPNVSVGAIRGGLPYKIGNSAGRCSIYLDVRIPPGKDPLFVKPEIEEVIRKTGVEAEVRPYMTRWGYIAKGHEPLVEAIRRGHERVIGKPLETVASPITSMWRDMNIFNEVQIPAATYGPSFAMDFSEGKLRRVIQADDLWKAAKAYALVAMDICSREAGGSSRKDA